ncbi:MAG: exosortase C-terminal domain/associated protein EpsI, partial [Sphingopyxis sp.]
RCGRCTLCTAHPNARTTPNATGQRNQRGGSTMIDRRDALIGLGGLLAIGGAEWLRPRHRIDLVGAQTLGSALPESFGPWAIDPGIGVLQPPNKGSLADRLYRELLSRAYRNQQQADRSPVMLLATHGASQSDALQLHRPEICYPAVGFAVHQQRHFDVPLAPGIAIPAVALTAQLGDRVEDIVYWTRIGEDFPQSGAARRSDRLRAALRGDIGDGVLVRLSAIRAEGLASPAQHMLLAQFAAALMVATPAGRRRAFIGTTRAARLA